MQNKLLKTAINDRIDFTCILVSGIAAAESAIAESDIQYYGGSVPRHDTKLEKAPIEIAGKKICDLRGSIDGNKTIIVLSAAAQDDRQG